MKIATPLISTKFVNYHAMNIQTDRQMIFTCITNMWGSLRLAPINACAVPTTLNPLRTVRL